MNLAGWIGFVFIVINLIGFIIFVLPYFKDKQVRENIIDIPAEYISNKNVEGDKENG